MPTRCSTVSGRSIREVEQYLGNVISIRRMQTREVPSAEAAAIARYDELFQFIRFCITGENHPVRLPDIPMYLDWLATAELQHGLTPKVENRFSASWRSTALPAESWPGILNSLDLMPLTYRWSSRFIFLDDQEAARSSSARARNGSRRCGRSSTSCSRRKPIGRPGRHG
jgi:type IV secretory pathway VirB4 component